MYNIVNAREGITPIMATKAQYVYVEKYGEDLCDANHAYYDYRSIKQAITYHFCFPKLYSQITSLADKINKLMGLTTICVSTGKLYSKTSQINDIIQ